MTYDQIKPYIEQGLINEQKHPECEALRIFNYTQKCQFSKAWDDVTKHCRGLIMNVETGEIIARPFPKFFNYEEHIANGWPLPDEAPVVYTKFDGSLGILYWLDGTPYVATRGSFTSEQARWATEFFRQFNKYWFDFFDPTKTYLFEIIYPQNRIVVDYKGYEGLALLAKIDTKTGVSLPLDDAHALPPIIRTPDSILFHSYERLKKLNSENREGFVLHYRKADVRVKVKFDDYVRLHRIMTGLSVKSVWEMLRDGVDPLTEDIPDEMHVWLKGVIENLKDKYVSLEKMCLGLYYSVKDMATRKEQANFILNQFYFTAPDVVFQMLDHKDYQATIWRHVKPRGSQTFTNDIDS